MTAQERTLLQALKDMTAEPKTDIRQILVEMARRANITERVKKAFAPREPFDATAWAASVVKVRPGRFGRGGDVVIGTGNASEHWTRIEEANESAARIRTALIASLPARLVSK